MCLSALPLVYVISTVAITNDKKNGLRYIGYHTSFSAPMKRLMLPDSIKKHFPMGHQWQYTQMRRVHLLGLHSQSALPQADHSSGSSSRDSALMCMHLCHIIQLVLQLTPTWHLNSLTNRVVMPWWHDCCSNWILYAALIQTRLQTCCLLCWADCYVTVTQCYFTTNTLASSAFDSWLDSFKVIHIIHTYRVLI